MLKRTDREKERMGGWSQERHKRAGAESPLKKISDDGQAVASESHYWALHISFHDYSVQRDVILANSHDQQVPPLPGRQHRFFDLPLHAPLPVLTSRRGGAQTQLLYPPC
jgi:hypothetical protein